MSQDVPSPIDLRDIDDAREWERTALSKRPSRPDFFELYATQISTHVRPIVSVLELGSGPGFLANHLLENLPDITYTALDFSGAMHELAHARLGKLAHRVQFIERSFKDDAWVDGLGAFDCVVTHQAIHELRHKRYATALHEQVFTILPAGGLYLICDHFAGSDGMINDQLYMTQDEQRAALISGGFGTPELLKTDDKLATYRAIR